MVPADRPKVSCTGELELPFFVSSNVEKADPATRKQIRSHAMRGRKQKSLRHQKNALRCQNETTSNPVETTLARPEDVLRSYTPPMPYSIGSDLAFSTFAEDLEPSLLLNIIKGQR